MTNRWDETWHRLIEWTKGQGPSERLSAQILLHEGYGDLDPSHPLGGKDGGKDALCTKNGKKWIMAVYFPRGQKEFSAIESKLNDDLKGVKKNAADGIIFVTNQELRLKERSTLASKASAVEIFHLERLTNILDTPEMSGVRKQFLDIDFSDTEIKQGISTIQSQMEHLQALQTGGDSFCYWMLYYFDMKENFARDFGIIRQGKYPLYDLRFRITDLVAGRDIFSREWGELNSPADYTHMRWSLPNEAYYRVFFHARNGNWHQDLQLKKSDKAGCWLVATKVPQRNFEHIDNGFLEEFGAIKWSP